MNEQVNAKATAGAGVGAGTGVVETREFWRDLLHVTKPGIIISNLFAVFGGFWLAADGSPDWLLLAAVLCGSALVMASACVFNNVQDREMDTFMSRTKQRPLAAGRMQPVIAIWYGTALGLVGLGILFAISVLCGILGAVGWFVYAVVYTAWLKRTSTVSTAVGGISGAMPPVIGYCAVTGAVDAAAWLLFLILFLWQPPHFWALGIRRKEEYRAAGFPLLPVVKGARRTKIQMIPYVALLIPATSLLTVYGYTGIFYLVSVTVLNAVWLVLCFAGLRTADENGWAKRAFLFSVYYLTAFFLILIADTLLQ